ncbi:MAG: acetoin utilization protein AcuC [Thermoleophilia bacterium]
MPGRSALIYSDSYIGYDFSPWHPMKPVRLQLTAELIKAYGLPDLPDRRMRIVEPRLATDQELALIHDPAYIDKVRELSHPDVDKDYAPGWGLGTGDNPVFPGMHDASATIAGGALVGAGMIMEGELDHVLHEGGGLHHAQHARASGFCIYNDVALAAAWLRKKYDARVLYLDFDAHHGDGVQEAFYDDSAVLTVSFHESGMYLFPGTGFTNETGAGEGRGYAVNLPLAPGTTDDIFLEAYDALVPELARMFQPDIIITQNGCDGHWSDPLTHMGLSLAGYATLGHRLHELVHEVAGGRWLGSGGGGYQAYTIVPRAWTRLMAEMADTELPEPLPESWRELCGRYAESEVPLTLTGDEPPVADPKVIDNARDLARKGAAEIREAVFPLY